MSLPTSFESLGISINITEPLVKTNRAFRSFDLVHRINSYSHEINIFGGFISATMAFFASVNEADEWYSEGLGRHVLVYGSNLNVIFEGFVDQIDYQIGDLTTGIGPLSSIGNRVLAVYTPIIDPGPPPIMGTKTETPLVNDITSQGRYGIWEKDLSGGNAYPAEIEAARDTYLLENKWPQTTEQRVTPLNNQQAQITLNCKGYIEWLNAYPFVDTTSGTVTVSTLIASVFGADTNSIFSTNLGNIASILTLTSGYQADYKKALDVIRAALNIGDAAFGRLTFQVLENRVPFLKSLPSDTAYVNRIITAGRSIETVNGAIVYPWDVRPGQWLLIPDFLVGRINTTYKREDPRYIMIESVRYTAPWDLEVNGAKINTLPQYLEQYGLGGLSG